MVQGILLPSINHCSKRKRSSLYYSQVLANNREPQAGRTGEALLDE